VKSEINDGIMPDQLSFYLNKLFENRIEDLKDFRSHSEKVVSNLKKELLRLCVNDIMTNIDRLSEQ